MGDGAPPGPEPAPPGGEELRGGITAAEPHPPLRDGAAEGRERFLVVADAEGFVGAFPSLAAARGALGAYPPRPYAASWHPRRRPGSETVWALPYRWLSPQALACVADDREVVAAAQRALHPLGLVQGDSLDYWEQEFGRVVPAAERRLGSARWTDPEPLEAALFGEPGLGRARDGELTDLLESVVVFPLPEPEGAGEETPAAQQAAA